MSDEMPLPILPQDVIQDILSRLPVKPLVRFRCVCRWWNSLIRDSTFIKLHLARIMLDIEKTGRWRILLSTLLIFRLLKIEHRENHYILWNPSTGECRTDLAIAPKVHLNDICNEFGYDSTMDDYKILRVTFAVEMKIWVLNVGSNFWRVFKLKDQILTRGLFTDDAIFAYGSLHWASSQMKESSALCMEHRTLSFSLVEEKFEEQIPLPKLYDKDHISKLSIVESSEKKVTISCDGMPEFGRYVAPQHFFRNGKVLVSLGKDVMIYDQKTGTFLKVDVRDISCFMVPLYIETLVSPFSVPSAKRPIQS
uniref:F-box domain-containing protein n=1 Tax=Kalanchoe fedtschenkoi TaxID=63787 RepID=A0A7N0TRC3_KALFE